MASGSAPTNLGLLIILAGTAAVLEAVSWADNPPSMLPLSYNYPGAKRNLDFAAFGKRKMGIHMAAFGKRSQAKGPLDFAAFGKRRWHMAAFGPLSPFSVEEYHESLVDLFHRYGPIVREDRGWGNAEILHVFDPSDMQTVFQAEGKMPYVTPLQGAVQLYRQMKDLSLGLGNMNGEDWYRLRSAVRSQITPVGARQYLSLIDDVAKDFLKYVESHRDENDEVRNFRRAILQWSLESSGNTVFEHRLGAIGAPHDSYYNKMIDANQQVFRLAGELKLSLPLYQFFPRLCPKMRKLTKNEDRFYSGGRKLLDKTLFDVKNLIAKGNGNEKYRFIRFLLSRDDITKKDLVFMVNSLFADGLNTTAPTLMFMLYRLARNPRVQEKLREEVSREMPLGHTVTPAMLSRVPYLKACIKETFRFHTNNSEVARILLSPLVLSGYEVPAQTHVDMSFVNLHDPEVFPKPTEFRPERWLRGSDEYIERHPFTLLPFGHGPRMCAGRRFAEQELQLVVSNFVQRFKIEHNHPDLKQQYMTLLTPKGSVQFTFRDR